jgi:two-component system cell cycle response regulator
MSAPPSSKGHPAAAGHLATQVITVDPVGRRTRGILTVATGPDAGRVLTLPAGELVTLGRAPDCTFPFDDPSLSREHARLMRVGDDWVVKDRASTNGTFVNDARIDKAVTLADGDRLQLGKGTTLRYALVDEAEEEALVRVYRAATRDGLTGVYNRKHLEERLDAEIEHAKRHGSALSVIITDVDHFKKVNDTHGHLAGDAVLKEVARRLGESLRPEDVLARYGGEEFVVVARLTEKDGAVALAERLRQALLASPVAWEDKQIPITASAGVASVACCGADVSKERLLGTADGRLYKAKEQGRNRVVGE